METWRYQGRVELVEDDEASRRGSDFDDESSISFCVTWLDEGTSARSSASIDRPWVNDLATGRNLCGCERVWGGVSKNAAANDWIMRDRQP